MTNGSSGAAKSVSGRLPPTKGTGRRARAFDRLGRYLIAGGGIGIIAAVLGIFVFIARETLPLFTDPEVEIEQELDLTTAGSRPTSSPLSVTVDPYREVAMVVRADAVEFISLLDQGSLMKRVVPDGLDLSDVSLTASYIAPDGGLALGTADGRLWTGSFSFDVRFEGDVRVVEPTLDLGAPERIGEGEAISALAYRQGGEERAALGVMTRSGRVWAVVRQTEETLFGPGETQQQAFELTEHLAGPASAIAVAAAADQLFIGTRDGAVWCWNLPEIDAGPPMLSRFWLAAPQRAVTAIELLLGDQSLIVGDEGGGLHAWFRVRETEADANPAFKRIHRFQSHEAPVSSISTSTRDKQFLTGAADGSVALHHATSEQTFLTVSTSGSVAVRDIALAPKSNGIAVLSQDGQLRRFRLANPHPEITLETLFGEIWYEGYEEPEYVWQSTGGTDEFEPKLSLVPLVFGTVKGTLYAMLFALPLAILAAIYTAEFASAEVRNRVKPTVEIMASLPSVILGFLAGLWLAPLLEHHLVGITCCLVAVPVVVLVAAWAWRSLPRAVRNRLPRWTEISVLIVVVGAASAGAVALGPQAETLLFGGSFQHWLNAETDLSYDQRNCVIIGFAMGFAVIPLIFTICEDALSSVPQSLRAGSLALGANRWQTAIKVVLPMAVPGVFSASMIGFGRAIGETMIVLMATGNTPIMEWNIFNGMRTISANIAVELPEAPHEGTLYRVLFLSGLLLFGVTFVVNTIAEVVRQRLREKYKRV